MCLLFNLVSKFDSIYSLDSYLLQTFLARVRTIQLLGMNSYWPSSFMNQSTAPEYLANRRNTAELWTTD